MFLTVLSFLSVALASDVPVPPVNPPNCGNYISPPIKDRPIYLGDPRDWPLLIATNPTGEILIVGAVQLDEIGDPIACFQLGTVAPYSTGTFDVPEILLGPLGFNCTTECELAAAGQ